MNKVEGQKALKVEVELELEGNGLQLKQYKYCGKAQELCIYKVHL
jgi:hypothetical protein